MSNPTGIIETAALLKVKLMFRLRASTLMQTSRSFCSFWTETEMS